MLADYRCPRCGAVRRDVFFHARDGARKFPPTCQAPDCCAFRMEWIPQAGFDLKGDGEGDKGFQKFTVHRQVMTPEGPRQVREVVDSLHTLRAIERDSEQRYRNGEGEPIRFRGYAQDSSNMDRGTFGAAGKIGEQAYDSGSPPVKSGRVKVTRHGAQKPQVAVVPGHGRSPL